MCSRSSEHDREAPGPEGIEVKRGEYTKMGVYDFVRRDIERFFAHPEEAIVSPELFKSKDLKPPPEFVRNVWGSAAGVGSGDFHIYRGIRRREYARLEEIEKSAEEVISPFFSMVINIFHKERLNEEFQEKQRELDELAESKTAKRRMKRQKKKLKRLNKKEQLKTTDSNVKEGAGSAKESP
ncbi:PRKR-interacting protein 1 [Fasciola hepatica]|uniref:PRKR-interacting protein 1 n=1 Tax=Fasciola hepatica TaxID=6192 RepID=A0A2H1BU21_FASHE|nr:PRKR-interacting protein 1 [Fasciola hepatica]